MEEVEAYDKLLLIITVTLVIFAALTNLSGNGLVIASYISSRACRQAVGTLIVNLAIADVTAVIGLLCLAVDTTNYISNRDLFTSDFLMALCSARVYCVIAFYHAQVFTIAGIAVNRCLRIAYAKIYTAYRQWGCQYWTLVIVWLLSFSVLIYIILDPDFSPHYESLISMSSNDTNDGSFCAASRDDVKKGLVLFFPGILVDVLCAMCYGTIFKYYRDSRKELLELASESNNSSPIVSNNFKNLTLHILTVLVLFGSQLLVIITIVYPFLSSYFKVQVRVVGYFIYLLNSSINPWLSIVFVKDFSTAVTALSQCRSMRSYKRQQAIQNVLQNR